MSCEIVSSPEVGHWVARRIRGAFHVEQSQAIGLERDGEIVAGVIYEHWNHRSIWCHIALEGRMTPRYLAAIFDYPFNRCQVDKIISPVAESNEESRRLVEKMGFREESRISDSHPDGDLLFFTMTRDSCRYIGEKYGKRLLSTSRA